MAIWAYRIKRLVSSLFDGRTYAWTKDQQLLNFNVKFHSSVLIRKLGESEIWLQHNKVRNLQIAIPHLNGTLIRPGETFSFCRSVGLPTKGKGYVEGMEIARGEARPGIGGGICQIANMIYWLALHTPLHVIERHHHGYDPFPDHHRTLPFGSGASVFYNYRDLRLFNPTPITFQLNLWLTPKCLEGNIRADKEIEFTYSVFERNHRFLNINGEPYRENEIWRNVLRRRGGAFVREELVTTNHARVKYAPPGWDTMCQA